ncbi:MAG: hypothetical protein NTY38_25225, partial [Acidobacteria bacterium]|nr:hypothetical protein [Acidobacteriota bacterium]
DWWCLAAGVLLVAAPWYLLCTGRNGRVFLVEFFGKHHFGRFFSGELKHGQPAWFYLPVLAGGLFPWTPVGLLLFSRRAFADERRQLLAATVLLGFLLFSSGENKLPGYLLPLLPPLAALMALRVVESRWRAGVLAGCVVFLGLVPVVVRILPGGLETGIRRSTFPPLLLFWLVPAGVLAVLALLIARRRAWWLPAALAGTGMASGVIYCKIAEATALDSTSIRPLARAIAGREGEVCVESLHRALRYGLNYYTVDPLPDCSKEPRSLRLGQRPGQRPEIRTTTSPSLRPPSSPAGSSG